MDIITLEEYKVYATISNIAQDDQINALIPASTEAIQAYLGYVFTDDSDPDVTNPRVVKSIKLQPYQTEYLLPHTDTDISLVTWRPYGPYGDSTAEVPSILEDTEWFADGEIGMITFIRPITRNHFADIEYRTSKTVTEDIKLATLMLVDYWRNKDFRQTITNQGQSVTSTPTRNLPKHVQALLNPHRKL